MTRLTTLKKLVRAFVGGAFILASAGISLHAQSPAGGVTIHADSADGGDIAIAALFADGSKKMVTTVGPGRDATIPFDQINFGKAQRIEVVAVDCNGQKTVLLVQPGAKVTDDNCKRRVIAAFIWGNERHFEVHFAPQAPSKDQSAAGHSAVEIWDRRSRDIGYLPWLEASGGFSSLTNTGYDCANVANENANTFNLSNTTCAFPSRAGAWRIGGGVDITQYARAGVFYEGIGTLYLNAVANAPPTASLNDTVTFGPAHFLGITVEGRYPLGRIVPYGTIGYAHWSLDQKADLFVLRDTQRTLDQPSSSHDTGWSPTFGGGVDVNLTNWLSVGLGYDRLTMSKGGDATFKAQHFNQVMCKASLDPWSVLSGHGR
jgi:opacity protein-like surface antigen